MNHDLAEYGFDFVPEALSSPVVKDLVDAFDHAPHAVRDLMGEIPEIAHLCQTRAVRNLVEPVLGPSCFAVRGIFFDKTPGANWKVPWHQDLTIAVREKCDVPGFGPWSCKRGIPHVQPPLDLLARMVTVRLHLDPCDADKGPLKVLPSTHRLGRLDAESIARLREEIPEVSCLVKSGGAMRMRPLILHASSAARSPDHRRVIHFEFSAEDLPSGLEWHGRW